MTDWKSLISTADSWNEFRSIVDSLSTSKETGEIFEHFVALFLRCTPEYSCQISNIWLFSELPVDLIQRLNLSSTDRGIDLIAETYDGEFWAIQCKYRKDPSGYVSLSELGTFGTQVGVVSCGFARGLICATKQSKTPDFVHAAAIPFTQVLLDTWESLDSEFWTTVKARVADESAYRLAPLEKRPYQQSAVDAAHRHFVTNGNRRGKLIMPCGAGKSLVAFWTAIEAFGAKKILITVPSLALARQTFRVWARETQAHNIKFTPLIVCSDDSLLSGLAIDELAAPVTTCSEKIESWLASERAKHSVVVVISTYQSGKILALGSKRFQFDVAIFDEAHKTAGNEAKHSQHLLFQKNISVQRRLFMTATERHYRGKSETIVGMNDKRFYGDCFHFLSFGEAIEKKMLADFTVLLMTVQESEITAFKKLIRVSTATGNHATSTQDPMNAMVGAIALRKATHQYGLSHAITFHSRNLLAKEFSEMQSQLNDIGLYGEIDSFRVSGESPTFERHKKLAQFEASDRAVVSNARCLTEGVDIPNVDLVLFAQPRQSKVDIVQAVGRALRKPIDQPLKRAYVLLPIFVRDGLDISEHVAGSGFENCVSVLKALSTVDDNIFEKLVVVAGDVTSKNSTMKSDASADQDSADTLLGLKDFADTLAFEAWDRACGLRKPRLTIRQILKWAKAHQNSYAQWPNRASGPISDSAGENWRAIDQALRLGRRGLAGGSSLRTLFAITQQPRLSKSVVREYARAHFTRSGKWPHRYSGRIREAEGDEWLFIDQSLRDGLRGLSGNSSLAKLLNEADHSAELGNPPTLRNPASQFEFSPEWIVDKAKEHNKLHGKWPTRNSGELPESDTSWLDIDQALMTGKLVAGARSLHSFLVQAGCKPSRNRTRLLESWIIERAEEYREKHGRYPTSISGKIDGSDDTWSAVDSALRGGFRGLSGNTSLPDLLGYQTRAHLTEEWILEQATNHHKASGKWPTRKSGEIPESETSWSAIDHALRDGKLVAGASSLHSFLVQAGCKSSETRTILLESWIIARAEEYRLKHGRWPSSSSGSIDGSNDTWNAVDNALRRGIRGLPGNSSLPKLLGRQKRPPLTKEWIVEQAIIHHEATGKWPSRNSGPLLGIADESWLHIDNALRNRSRGLTDSTTLSRFLESHGLKRRPLPLTTSWIAEQAIAFHKRNGEWPKTNSGKVCESVEDTWSIVNQALRKGSRGLPGGSSLKQFVSKLKGKK